MKQKDIKTILIEYLQNNTNNNTVYHITSSYYKQNIIKNGLEKRFEITQAQIDSLIDLLRNEAFGDLNTTLYYELGLPPQTTSERIEECWKNINKESYVISASSNVMSIFDYLKEETKGGQYLKEIKRVIAGIKQKVYLDSSLQDLLNENINELIAFIEKINSSTFLLCIINKDGIKETTNSDRNIFHSSANIPTSHIIEIIEISSIL